MASCTSSLCQKSGCMFPQACPRDETPSQLATRPEGVIRLSIELKVEMHEMKDWPPQCVSAFFDGIARAQEAAAHGREAAMATKRGGER